MITTLLIPCALSATAGGALVYALIKPVHRDNLQSAKDEAGYWEDEHGALWERLRQLAPLAEVGQRRQAATDAQNRRNRAKRAPRADGAVIVVGPQGCGKTTYLGAMALALGCKGYLVDEWDGRTPLQPGDFALINADPYLVQEGATVLSFQAAMSIVQEKQANAGQAKAQAA